MLTPQEKLELEQLEKEVGSQMGKLTPQEQSELAQLESELGGSSGIDKEAALAGFGQGATLGYLPQVSAVTQMGVSKAQELFSKKPEKTTDKMTPAQIIALNSNLSEADVDRLLKESGFSVPEQGYTELRDEETKRLQGLQQQSPVSFGVGQATGGLTTGLATAGVLPSPISGGKALANVAKTTASGGILGFLSNPGDMEGVVDPIQVKERLKEGLKTAAIGAGFQTVGQGVSAIATAVKNSPKTVRTFANLKAIKATGAMLKEMRQVLGKNQTEKLGKEIFDNNLVQMGDTIEDVAKKSLALRQEIGEKIGDIYKNTDDAAVTINNNINKLTPSQVLKLNKSEIDLEKFAELTKKKIINEFRGKAGSTEAIGSAFKRLDEIAENGASVPLAKLKEIRGGLDDMISWHKSTPDLKASEMGLLSIRNKLNNAIMARISTVDKIIGNQNNTRELLNLNKKFSNLAKISDFSADMLARQNANRVLGLSEQIGGGVGATVGTMLGGAIGTVPGIIIGGLTANVLRKYGNSTAASIGEKVAKVLENNPGAIGKFGETLITAASKSPKDFMNAINGLRKDPEFRQTIKGL